MYSGGHILHIPSIYTMQPLEGCAAYIIKREGLGVEVHTTATTRPWDILEKPLPCQKWKGCDICGGLKQLSKLSARRAHCVLRRNNSWNCFFKGDLTYNNTKKKEEEKASIEITSVSMPIPSMVCSYILTRQATCFGLDLLFQLDLAS